MAGAVVAAPILAVAEDPLLAGTGRAALLLAALGALAFFVRRRGAAEGSRAAIEVAERRPLSRDAAVALLHVGGRALLVGYGADGVRLLADLGAAGRAEGEARP